MTILPAHTQRDIRNLATASLSILAYQFKCEVPDILALLSQPSQAPQAPAASTPAVAPAVVKAEEVSQAAFSATEPQPTSTPAAQAHIVDPLDERPTSLPGADGAVDPATIQPETATDSHGRGGDEVSPPPLTQQGIATPDSLSIEAGRPQSATLQSDTSDREVPPSAGTVGALGPGKTAEPSGSAAPAKKLSSVAAAVRKCHVEHPDWPARLIARHLGVSYQRVTTNAIQAGIRLPTQQEYDDAQVKARAAQLAREKGQADALPIAATLTQRIRTAHQTYPDWTAPQIANYLNAAPASVSTILASVRKEVRSQAVPEFAGKAALQQHYGDVAKRLGKPS